MAAVTTSGTTQSPSLAPEKYLRRERVRGVLRAGAGPAPHRPNEDDPNPEASAPALHGGIPVVLDCVVGAARKECCDLGPLRSVHAMCVDD